jgi:hypothetical protein
MDLGEVIIKAAILTHPCCHTPGKANYKEKGIKIASIRLISKTIQKTLANKPLSMKQQNLTVFNIQKILCLN